MSKAYNLKYNFADPYFLLTIIIFLASFRAPNVTEEALSYSVPFYIEALQKYSLYIISLLMFISLIQVNKLHNGKIGKAKGVVFFFIFQNVIAVTSLFYNGNLDEFLNRFFFSFLTFFYFFFIVSNLEFYSFKRRCILNSVFWGAFLFTSINLLVYLLTSASVMWNGRLFGVTGHPNFLGICGSICSCLALFYFSKENKILNKFLFIIGMASGIYISLLSGSRNSLASIVLAFGIYIFFSIKKLEAKLLFLILFSFIALVAYNKFAVNNTSLFELADYENRGNTREDTWSELYEVASNLPLFGLGRTGATSNSYLFSIVATGLIGAIFLYASIFQVIILFFKKSFYQIYKESFNLYLSLTILLLFAALFEGFLLDIASLPVFIYWLLLSHTVCIKPVKKTHEY